MAFLKAKQLTAAFAEVREKVTALQKQRAVVAWLSNEETDSTYIPVDRLSVAVIVRGQRPHLYFDGKKNGEAIRTRNLPVIMALSPAIYDNGTVLIGAVDWFRYTKQGRVVYTRDKIPGSTPAGLIRDLLCRDYHNPLGMSMSAEHKNSKIQWMIAKQAVKIAENVCFEEASDLNNTILTPTLMLPRRKTPLKLRYGPELLQWTLHCARTGRWKVVGGPISASSKTAVQDRGSAKALDGGDVRVKCSDVAVEHVYKVEDARSAFEQCIEDTFGCDVCVPITPVVPVGRYKAVRLGEPLFGPLPRKNWTEAELKDLPEDALRAAFYLAAISSGKDIGDVPHFDLSMVMGDSVPVADMSSVPAYQHVMDSAYGLTAKSLGMNVTLLNFIKHYMRLSLEERRNQLSEKPPCKITRTKKEEEVKALEQAN